MGYPCDDCGKYLDTNVGSFEYDLESTGHIHLCWECRDKWVKEGRFVSSWKEGWKKPKRARLYHYYQGRVWKGGLTTRPSLCKRSSYPDRDLENGTNMPDDEKCKICLKKFRQW